MTDADAVAAVDESLADLNGLLVGEKAEWSTAYQNNLPDSSFLYIGPGGKKDDQGKTTPRSLRKFPVQDASGRIDLDHLRNAIARIPQATGLSAQQKSQLQERARNMLAKATGAGAKDVHEMPPEYHRPWGGATSFAQWREMRQAFAAEDAVQELVSTFRHLVDNILADEMMDMAAKPDRIIALTQELKREIQPAIDNAVAMVKETAEDRPSLMGRITTWLRGAKDEPPASDDGSIFRIFRTKDGELRWLAIWTNPIADREGETFGIEAHKEYLAWTDATGYRPELRWWHVPGTKLGETKTLAMTGEGFMLAEGTIDEAATKQADRLAAGEFGPLAVSHGYLFDEKDLVDGVYTRYRSFEISVLPAVRAANPFTGWMAGQEVPMITDSAKRKSLVDLWGEPYVKELESRLESASKAMRAQGISFKEYMSDVIDSAAAAPEPPPPAETPPPPAAGGVPGGAEIMAALGQLTTAVTGLQEENKAIRAQLGRTKETVEGEEWRQRNIPPFIASASKESELDVDAMTDAQLVAAAEKAREASALDGVPEHSRPYMADVGLVNTK